MSDFLFDTPWWLVVLIIAAGIGLFVYGNSLLNAKLRTAGVIVLLVGVTLGMLSYFVDTDKDKVTKRTEQIVTSVGAKDWPTFESLLDPRASFAGEYNNRDQIVEGAKKTVQAIGLTSASITSMEVNQTGTIIRVDLNARSEQDATLGRPVVSSWRFDWQDTGSGWKLLRIEPLENGQVKKADVMRHLAKP